MLPEDGLAATAFNADVPYRAIPNKDILATEMMLDIGPKAIDTYQQALKEVRTVLWNGPMGAFEISPFDTATVTLAQMVAEATEAGASYLWREVVILSRHLTTQVCGKIQLCLASWRSVS